MRRPALLLLVLVSIGHEAQAAVWQPSTGHAQIPLWPGTPPHPQAPPAPESVATADNDHLVAGKPWQYISNVSQPTLTVYPPTSVNTGAAVIVFPGGGYQILAIDLEGTEVCDWLNSIGVTAVLVKYRVPNRGPAWDQACGCDRDRKSSQPLEDAQRAISLVRVHAKEWNVDPHKIGVIGFSAGGHLVASVSTHFERRVYEPVDGADEQSCRPDFALAIYPGHLWISEAFELNPEIRVTRDTPPTFLVHAENDPIDPVNHSLVYYRALKQAGVPAELHLYAEGKHAFGLRPTNLPITGWPRLAETWLKTIGMIPR
jgi:acetyl esterase/lipase